MLDIYQHRVFAQLKIYWNILFLMLRQVTRDKVYINNGNITEKTDIQSSMMSPLFLAQVQMTSAI